MHWQQELANIHYGNKGIFHVNMRKSIHLYHSGIVDNTGRHGVIIALSEAAQVALLAWVPISPRLASARLPTKHHHGSPLVMPVQPAPGECHRKSKYNPITRKRARYSHTNVPFLLNLFHPPVGFLERMLTLKHKGQIF